MKLKMNLRDAFRSGFSLGVRSYYHEKIWDILKREENVDFIKLEKILERV
jgi:hypothetical protein